MSTLSCTTVTRIAEAQDCNTKNITNQIKRNIKSIPDYRFLSHVSLGDVNVDAQISGKPPNLMRIRLSISQDNTSLITTTVFDGHYQWTETKYPNKTEVTKIKLSKIVSQNRPFDTSYYVMGSGLLNGEDYPATILTLLSIYDLHATCTTTSIRLAGKLNTSNFQKIRIQKAIFRFSRYQSKQIQKTI